MAKSDLKAMNDGILRHPVFGDRKVWKEQRIRAGFFDDAAKEGQAVAMEILSKAVDAGLAKLRK